VLSRLVGANDAATYMLTGAAASSTLAFAYRLDRARNELEEQYAPTYASKLLSLGAAAFAPLAAALAANESDSAIEAIIVDSVISGANASVLTASTSSDEYRIRVEEYKGFDLDLWLPLAGVLFARRELSTRVKIAVLAGSLLGWQLTRRLAPDPLARFDASPAMSHTHHLSTAMRVMGDTMLKLGPRPIRKWAGLAPFGLAVGVAARRRGLKALASVAMTVSVLGHAAANTGFRRPERDPRITARDAARSWIVGSLAGWLAALIINHQKSKS
jgi:hypothetical protein